MNLKYLFYGAIVATTLQVKSAEGENIKPSKQGHREKQGKEDEGIEEDDLRGQGLNDTIRAFCNQLVSGGAPYCDQHVQEPREQQDEAFLSPEGLASLLETVAQRAAADPERAQRREYAFIRRDNLYAAQEQAWENYRAAVARHVELLKHLEAKPEDESTQQLIYKVRRELSHLNEKLKSLAQESEELLKVLQE